MSLIDSPVLVPEPEEAPRGVGQRGAPAGAPVSSTHRTLSVVAALGLLWPTSLAWGGIVAAPVTGLAVIVLFGAILWLAHAVITAPDEVALCRLDRWLLVVGLLALGAWTATYLRTHTYGSDEAAFTQGAATLLLHGHDPYGAHLAGWLDTFGINSRVVTFTMSGGTVDTFGYPALPLLVAAPFVWLTGGGQAIPIVDVLVLMATTVAAFLALRPGLRPLCVVVAIGFPTLSQYALSGMVEILAVAALTVVAARWTDIGASGRLTRRDAVRGAALGLALATNQLAWFISPFFFVAVFLVRRPALGPRRAAALCLRFLLIAVAVFAAVNAPFVAWDPSAWLHGVSAPLTQHAIPYGQGLVGLAVFLRLGGGRLDLFNDAGALLYLALLILFSARVRRLGPAWVLLPTAALFVSGRSLAAYWMVLGIPLLVSVASAEMPVVRRAAQLHLRPGRPLTPLTIGLSFVPAALSLTLALTVRSPLELRVVSAKSDEAVAQVTEVHVFVHNRSSRPMAALFSLNSSGQGLSFLRVVRGPRELAPGSSAVYDLRAPDAGAMTPDGTPFIVQAFSTGPRAVSSSPSFAPAGRVANAW
jgi:hypothetical protein